MSTGSNNREPSQIVEVLLAEAGLQNMPTEELQRLAQLYPGLRRSVDRFHEIEVGDEVTAAVFRAEAKGGSHE